MCNRTDLAPVLILTILVVQPLRVSPKQPAPRGELDPSEPSTSIVEQPIERLMQEFPELEGLEPATSQAELPYLLNRVGESEASLLQDFSNTASTEQVRQEKLRRDGTVRSWREEEFDYLFLAKQYLDSLFVDEHRSLPRATHSLSANMQNDFMLTSGFASAPLHFHPKNQPETEFRYLGRQFIDGQGVLVLAFAQHPDASGFMCVFKSGSRRIEVRMRGLAWINPVDYHVVRMRTDLLRPFPDIGLARITTNIRFSDVQFKQDAARMWLPREVIVSVEWRNRILRNFHRYSDFRLFSVKTEDRRSQRDVPVITSRTSE